MIPGEIFYNDEPVTVNADRPTRTLQVTNRGDRPIQVGSHFHFFEVNPALDFDRRQAYGMRLDMSLTSHASAREEWRLPAVVGSSASIN